MKNNYRKLSLLIFATLLLASCGSGNKPASSSTSPEDSSSMSSTTGEDSSEGSEGSEGGEIVFPIEDEGEEEQEEEHDVSYSIHTDVQLEYLNSKNYSILPTNIFGQAENSKPKPIVIEALADGNDLSTASDFQLKLSKNSDMSNAVSYVSATKEFSLVNLEIATTYYYTYSYKTTSGDYESSVKEFYIKGEAPRILDVDGVTNFRDVGGFRIGKSQTRTKQGLVYRCARLHTNDQQDITEKGKQTVKDLKIKTEIDLRVEGNTKYESAVEGVNFVHCPMNYENSLYYDEDNIKSIKKVFDTLAVPTNYPVMFHCAIGTDRTGFISYILNTLAGVNGIGLYHDYMFSNFANINGARTANTIDNYIDIFTYQYGGTTLSIGAANYLDSIGVSQENIIKVKQYLTGEVDPLKEA